MGTVAIDLHPFRTGTIALDDTQRNAVKSLINAPSSDSEFANFITRTLEAFLSPSADAADDTFVKRSAATLPSSQLSAGLSSFQAILLDFCRCNTPASAVTSALEDLGAKPARTKATVDVYTTKVEAVRTGLAAAGMIT
jgi:hypothetical protein